MTNMIVKKLEITGGWKGNPQEYGKFTLIIEREANFTNSPAVHPFTVESVVEWEIIIELLDEFYQDEYAYQLNNLNRDDQDEFNYPAWFDGEMWHESETLDEWIKNGNAKEFANQFIEKYKDMVLLETQYAFKAEMKIVERSKQVAA